MPQSLQPNLVEFGQICKAEHRATNRCHTPSTTTDKYKSHSTNSSISKIWYTRQDYCPPDMCMQKRHSMQVAPGGLIGLSACSTFYVPNSSAAANRDSASIGWVCCDLDSGLADTSSQAHVCKRTLPSTPSTPNRNSQVPLVSKTHPKIPEMACLPCQAHQIATARCH